MARMTRHSRHSSQVLTENAKRIVAVRQQLGVQLGLVLRDLRGMSTDVQYHASLSASEHSLRRIHAACCPYMDTAACAHMDTDLVEGFESLVDIYESHQNTRMCFGTPENFMLVWLQYSLSSAHKHPCLKHAFTSYKRNVQYPEGDGRTLVSAVYESYVACMPDSALRYSRNFA